MVHICIVNCSHTFWVSASWSFKHVTSFIKHVSWCSSWLWLFRSLWWVAAGLCFRSSTCCALKGGDPPVRNGSSQTLQCRNNYATKLSLLQKLFEHTILLFALLVSGLLSELERGVEANEKVRSEGTRTDKGISAGGWEFYGLCYYRLASSDFISRIAFSHSTSCFTCSIQHWNIQTDKHRYMNIHFPLFSS